MISSDVIISVDKQQDIEVNLHWLYIVNGNKQV